MIHLELYRPEASEAWDQFVEQEARNASFLHTRKFFSHNPNNATDDSSLMFYKHGKLVAVLPANVYQSKEGNKVIHSHQRATYGGFAIGKSVGVEDALAIVALTVAYGREAGADEMIIRNPFRIYNQLPSDETDYAMWYHGFTLKSREIESAIRLTENIKDLYADGTKRSTRKALKSVTVEFSTDYEAYWEMLTSNLVAKHGVKPVHDMPQFQSLLDKVGPDHIKLLVAKYEGRIIGGIVVFLSTEVIHAQYIASDNEFQSYRPVNAVIDFIISWGITNKFAYFNLGSGNEDAGRTVNAGLFNFKEGFGGRGVLRETMSITFNR